MTRKRQALHMLVAFVVGALLTTMILLLAEHRHDPAFNPSSPITGTVKG